MKRTLAVLLAAAMMLSLTACGGNGNAQPQQEQPKQEEAKQEEPKASEEAPAKSTDGKLRRNEIVRVGFTAPVAGFTWSPLLIAQVMGYFDEEGIDVVFEQSYSSSATRMVAANQVEFSTPGPHLTSAGIASGMDIISVFQWYPVDIFGFAVMEDSDIKTIADLEGKKIGTMTPTTANQVIPIIEAAGVDSSKVEMIPVGDARVQQLTEKTVDAVWTWDGEWQQWKAEGINIRYLSGQEVYKSSSNSIIASTQLVAEYPELVEGFSRALAKGSYFCYKNPRAAADIIISNWTSLLVDLDTAEEIVKTSVNFMTGGKEVMEGNTIGQHSDDSWNLMMKDYVRMGIVPEEVPLEKCFTNQFVEKINDWDRAQVDKDAADYQYVSK
ncbi:MAG: ABC transporter substrate-binding protein [Lachnospiraceae bacterium]|nr:ABC transporter substrate-binding protein [Lachnospiraceae bacterium]